MGKTTVNPRYRAGTGILLSGKTTMCAHVYNHSLGVFFFSIFRKRQPEFSPTNQCPSAHVQLWKTPHSNECVREAAWKKSGFTPCFLFLIGLSCLMMGQMWCMPIKMGNLLMSPVSNNALVWLSRCGEEDTQQLFCSFYFFFLSHFCL